MCLWIDYWFVFKFSKSFFLFNAFQNFIWLCVFYMNILSMWKLGTSFRLNCKYLKPEYGSKCINFEPYENLASWLVQLNRCKIP